MVLVFENTGYQRTSGNWMPWYDYKHRHPTLQVSDMEATLLT